MGGRVPGPSRPTGGRHLSPTLRAWAPPALKIVASPSKMLRGPENCVQSGHDVPESSGVLELVCVSS